MLPFKGDEFRAEVGLGTISLDGGEVPCGGGGEVGRKLFDCEKTGADCFLRAALADTSLNIPQGPTTGPPLAPEQAGILLNVVSVGETKPC